MSKTDQIRVRLEPEIKQQANAILEELGMSVSDAVSLFMRQVIQHRGLPFSVNIPNAQTIAAIEEVKQGKTKRTSLKELDEFFESLE